MAAALLWRYSLRWGLPHRPCPDPHELAAAEVPAGQQCPPEVANLWRPGTGYVVCIDFPQAGPVKQWSQEARARVRQRNLAKRLARDVPLFADELYAAELEKRRGYYDGQR